MLFEFIATHREVIIARTREKVASRTAPHPTEVEIAHGVPLFLDQLAARLGPDTEPGVDQLSASASLHGGELLHAGFTIGQVVQDYGDVCQAITELAVELGPHITNEDFRTLNLCLDIAITDAVTEYARQSERAIVGRGVEHLGFLAHELRNLLNTATLAFDAVRLGNVAPGGSTASLVAKSLASMTDLVNRSLAEVRLESARPRIERIPMASLLEEIEIAAAFEARSRDVELSIRPAESDVAVEGDAHILASIVTNLVQNACKFSRPRGLVTLAARVTPDRVLIDIADACGGLPAGKAEELFRPYEQRHKDHSGLGLGLAISLKSARAIGGDISVRNLPGTGCIFTVDLRRFISAEPGPVADSPSD
jgi:signal transduction histidine kinase